MSASKRMSRKFAKNWIRRFQFGSRMGLRLAGSRAELPSHYRIRSISTRISGEIKAVT
jgi:hypothetical protein